MKKRVIFVSAYLLSFIGGAEKSMYEELKLLAKTKRVECYTFDDLYGEGKFVKDNLTVYNFPLEKKSRFSYLLNGYKNREFILKKLNEIDISDKPQFIIQSLISPIVASFCIKNNLNYTYFLRDELNINFFVNYESRFHLKLLKNLKDIYEKKYIGLYKKENLIALKNAKLLIVNSKFMHNFLKTKYKLNSKIVLPKVDYSKLNRKTKINPYYITFIGVGNSKKGYDIALKIANRLKKEQFLFIGSSKKFKKGNIIFEPNSKNVMDVYSRTKLLIIPSVWLEAYGRIGAEAKYLNIPVLGSNRGGIPEVLSKNEIVSNPQDIDLWVKKINGIKKKSQK